MKKSGWFRALAVLIPLALAALVLIPGVPQFKSGQVVSIKTIYMADSETVPITIKESQLEYVGLCLNPFQWKYRIEYPEGYGTKYPVWVDGEYIKAN
jgi:hypothetical protein